MTKTALITGGSSGLGYVFAEELGTQGYHVIILARDPVKIDTVVASLKVKGISAMGISCDISDEKQLKTAFDTVKSEVAQIDFLILNAGMVIPQLLSDYSDISLIRKQLDINLSGTIITAWQFLPLLQKGSKVLITSSGFGLMGAAGYTLYCATKAGLINFGESLRRELLCKGINVYVSCPGDMDTPQFHEEIRTSPDWMKTGSPRKTVPVGIEGRKILKQCHGKMKFLILPAFDVKLLAVVSKILPRKIKDYLLDKMFPQPDSK
ncbi:MAG: SDR family NAD(P)-dependent oxidoreductase [Bacteroidetes bacterium]|nr:SDR family NAD(P)-dependent oxidoreductase [Bacteroidota bacterium]